jgi:hypothetical protein
MGGCDTLYHEIRVIGREVVQSSFSRVLPHTQIIVDQEVESAINN